MATKNKTKKRQTESKRTVGKKVTPMKKAGKKKVAKKKAAPKKAVVETKAGGKKTTAGKTGGALKRPVRGKSQSVAVALEGQEAPAGEESGDLQGLSNVAGADSESVDELLEEGNAFEAEVISGVESALDPDEAEVTTHEVPEDDVSSEDGRES
jgi:hypothetical protein